MNKRYRIAFVGLGNVYRHFSVHFAAAGHSLQAYHSHELEKVDDCDLLFLTVTDDRIEECSKRLPGKDSRLVIHMSGSLSMDQLEKHPRRAVCWPCNSFSGAAIFPLKGTAVFLEAQKEDDEKLLRTFWESLETEVVEMPSEQRQKMHLAATISNNFSNFLYVQVQAYCQQQGLDFRLLLPMLQNQLQRLEQLPAAELQTGAAKRHDIRTLRRHEEMLMEHPELRALYIFLSDSIRKHFPE